MNDAPVRTHGRCKDAACFTCGRRRAQECGDKRAHATLNAAQDHAEALCRKDGDPLSATAYRCRWQSDHWHVGHTSAGEYNKLARRAAKRRRRDERRVAAL